MRERLECEERATRATVRPAHEAARRRVAPRLALATLALVALAAGIAPQRAPAAELDGLRLLRIGTGGADGTSFPIGRLLARAFTQTSDCPPAGTDCGVPGVIAVAQLSNGSVSNVRALSAGDIELAFCQADIARRAYSATGAFEGKAPMHGLRAVAHLYDEQLQVVVRRGLGIRSIADLRGRRVSLDEPGSGTLIDARAALAAYGLSVRDLRPAYMKPQFAIPEMEKGELDAFFVVAGFPANSIRRLARRVPIKLLPIPRAKALAIARAHPDLSPGVIPAGVYPGVDTATPTIAVGTDLLVDARLPEPLVYRLTKALWGARTRALLDAGHAAGAGVVLAHALRGLGVPLAAGAARYYREREISLAGVPVAPGVRR